MRIKKFKKWHLIWMLPVAFLITANLAGCFQFRDSDRKIASKLKSKHLFPSFHDYKNGKQTIHYWDIPNAGKPLVMFVHGSPGSSTALMTIATDSVFMQHFMPVLVDRPGFGYSNFGRGEQSLSKQSTWLTDILKLYPNEKKILVGHSLGGPLVAKMAMDYPNEISAIVILAGSIDPDLEPKEWYRKPMNSPFIRWLVPKAFAASNDEILTLKSELQKMIPDWEKIKIPIVVIQGTDDFLVNKGNADFAKKMAKNAPIKVKMLPKESHFFPFTKPQITVEELLLLESKLDTLH